MGVPKQKHTKSRRNKRRGNIFLKKPNFSACPKCKKPVLSHKACFNCGYYKGREVIDVLKKLDKKERKAKEKEIHAKNAKEEGKNPSAGENKPLGWEDLSRK